MFYAKVKKYSNLFTEQTTHNEYEHNSIIVRDLKYTYKIQPSYKNALL